jgi:tetratricopeptide (TPR) repeat protein
MTKPVVVTLPLVLLLLDYWPLERVKKVSGVKLITEKIPLLALSIILCVITFVSQQSGEAGVSLERISLGGRIANMFMTYISYIGKTIWPSGLAVFYPHPRINLTDATVISCVLLFVLITALLIHTGRRRKYAATGWLWYLGTLVPVVGLLQVGSQAMANRYMYIPIVGLVIPVAWAAKEHVAKLPRWRVVWSLLGTGVLLSAVIVTRTQVRHWQNSMTVFEYALKATQNNGPAENSYGCALAEAGRVSEAELHFANAVRINPASFGARNNLGNAFVKQGKYNEAIACFNGILQQNENSAEARYNLAVALGVQKKYDEAIKNLAKVLSVDPNYPDARNKMGLALLATDRIEEAVACFNELLQQNENSAEAHYNLAVALCVQKKYDEAVKHLTKVLELDPEYPNARNSMASAQLSAGRAEEAIGYRNESLQTNKDRAEVYAGIGTAYIQLGKYEAALQNLSRAIELKPDYIEALNDMAWVLATVDDVSVQDANRAISYAERACELTGYKEANLLDTLAAAYAASGRFNDAITTAGQAVEAAKTNGKEDLANEIQNSIKLYQTGQRKRQK